MVDFIFDKILIFNGIHIIQLGLIISAFCNQKAGFCGALFYCLQFLSFYYNRKMLERWKDIVIIPGTKIIVVSEDKENPDEETIDLANKYVTGRTRELKRSCPRAENCGVLVLHLTINGDFNQTDIFNRGCEGPDCPKIRAAQSDNPLQES
jgi:hypothetical protein